MAKRANRYLEARMYMAGGSVGLLLILWSAFAIKDRALLSQNAAATDAQVDAVPTAAPTAVPTAEPAASSSSSRSSSTAAQVTAAPTAAPTATPQPQTRSKPS